MTAGFTHLAERAVHEHGAQQRPFELAELCRLLIAHGVERVLEVGTCAGGSAWCFAELGLDVTAVDIDLGQLHAPHPAVTYLEARSATVAPDGWDAVLIDGDHGYQGVSADWERFHGARIVAFHDILPHDPVRGCGVDRLWAEIAPTHATVEIVDTQRDWGGIGVVFR